MKNTRKSFVRMVVALVITVFLIMFVSVGSLWILNDRDANFLQIDDCLDQGGAWDSSLSECNFE